ncbi:MAG TPA: hypothetical protein VKU00_13950 [Chthonomonadaceae bacterium]|nr:hypothetical protein [Chthonomonadaceae bacterium]
MSDNSSEAPNLIDRSVKALFRECPTAILRLTGMEIAAEQLRVEDPNLNLPELRADHVFIVQPEEAEEPYAIYLEYQLEPDVRILPSWSAKWGGLNRQLGMPVALLALYLHKGDRATFPDRFVVRSGAVETELRFTTIRLWEHTDRIRSGALPELAPLLLLCEENPTEETIREEVALIHASRLPVGIQAELLGIALLVATRTFARKVLLPIFQEDWKMIEGLEILDDLYRDTGKLDAWIAEAQAEGEARGIRKTLMRLGRKRFGEPSAEVLQALEAVSSVETLQQMTDRLLGAENWEDLIAFLPS